MPKSYGTKPVPAVYEHGQNLLSLLTLICVGILVWANLVQGRVSPDELVDAVFEEPVQGATVKAPFKMEYHGTRYRVKPVASYELVGYVASHNDPTGFGDSYHDEDSVDTLDLCVLWGPNAENGVYQNVEVNNTSWTCWVKWERGVPFSMRHLSNNHLITDDAQVRETINGVHVGDQVRFSGYLVNYSKIGQRGSRRSSLTREDTGNTACEVVFVEEIEVLRAATPVAYFFAGIGPWFLLGIIVLKLLGGLWRGLRSPVGPTAETEPEVVLGNRAPQANLGGLPVQAPRQPRWQPGLAPETDPFLAPGVRAPGPAAAPDRPPGRGGMQHPGPSAAVPPSAATAPPPPAAAAPPPAAAAPPPAAAAPPPAKAAPDRPPGRGGMQDPGPSNDGGGSNGGGGGWPGG